MLARMRDWLIARVKAHLSKSAARARSRAAPIARETPTASFVSELERLLGPLDADRSSSRRRPHSTERRRR
jgi:hypothetical protein